MGIQLELVREQQAADKRAEEQAEADESAESVGKGMPEA